MSKRKICLCLVIGFMFGIFFGSAIGYVIGGNDGVNQVTEKIEEAKVYENVISKEVEEVDVSFFPTLPIFEKAKENPSYKKFNAALGIESIEENDKFEPIKKKLYRVTTQTKNEDGEVYQSTRVVTKSTYDSIKEGDNVYFDEDNNVQVK